MTAPGATLRAALQCRVSKATPGARDAEVERSVTEQEAEAEGVCAEQGWTVVARYAEPPGSASRFARRRREMWDQLLADLAAGQWDVLVMWETSRANRELEAWARFLNLCRTHRVLVHVVEHERTYDVRIARDWRTLADEGVDAAYDPEQISGRVRRGLRANLAAGMPHGRLPYGYLREYDPRTRRYVAQVIDPAQADVIRTAARRYLSGDSLRTICRSFDGAGVSTPHGGRAWDVTGLKRLLTNPTYIAQRTSGGVVTGPGAWDPILEVADFRQIAARLQRENGHLRVPKESRVKYLLSGLGECGLCEDGGLIRVLVPKNKVLTYTCHVCTRVARRVVWVDAYVTAVLLGILADPRYAELLAEHDDSGHRAALEELDVLRTRLADVAERAAEGGMSAGMAAAIERKLTPKLAAAERAAERSLAASAPLLGMVGPDAAAKWKAATLEQRRAVLRSAVTVRILPLARRTDHNDESRIEVRKRRVG